MAYSPTDFYGSLRVNPDNSATIYQGYADMGKGLADGITSAGQYIGQQRSDDKNRAFQQAMQQDQQGHASELQQAGFAHDLQAYGMKLKDDKAAKAEERKIKADELMNYGKGRAASVIALAEVSGSPMAKTMAQTLGKITDGKALADTSDAFLQAIMTEAESNKPDKITEMPVNGGRNTALLRNGQLFNVLGGGPDTQPALTPDQLQAYGTMFPNASVTAKLPGGVTISQKPPQEQSQGRVQTMNIPGPQVAHPTLPGQMIDGPSIPVKINPDGTYEPLKPKGGGSAGNGSGGYGSQLFGN